MGNKKGNHTLYVVKGNNSCLLNCNWLKHICLDWKRIASSVMKGGHQLETLFKNYDMVCKEDLGTLQSAATTLHVKPNFMCTPNFLTAHPVPYAIKESMELELDRLESMGIIKKLSTLTELPQWCQYPKGMGNYSYAEITK